MDSVSPVTVTPSAPSPLTAMKRVSVGVSPESLDPNATAVHEDSSTSRREAAHVRAVSRTELFSAPVKQEHIHIFIFSSTTVADTTMQA